MSADQLQDHLAPDERLARADSATLVDGSTREDVSVGVTNRRLLCTSDAGTFVSLWYDHVCSIRSRRRTRTTVRGSDHRLLMAAGGVLATLAFVGTVALADGALVPVLALVASGGIAAAYHLWPSEAGFDADSLVAYANDRLAEFDENEDVRTIRRRILEDVDDRHRAAGAGLLGTLAFGGVVAVTQGVLAPVLAAAVAGGVALVAFAHRHSGEFDGVELAHRRERLVSIDTVDGRNVRLRVDAEARLDRDLGRHASAATATQGRVLSPPDREDVTELEIE